MDLADNGVVAGIPQGIGEDLLERLLLGSEGNGRRRAQAGVDEFGVQLLGIFGKIQEAVDVGGTVVEGREQEAGHGRLHPPVPGPFFDEVGGLIVGEPRL